MPQTTRTNLRRGVAALALVVVGSVLPLAAAGADADAGTGPAPQHLAMESKPGSLTYLRARYTDATGRVPARAVDPSKTSTARATFVVTYHGFPSNAKAAFQKAVDLWSTLVTSSQPIRVDATWAPLGDGILGGAGPSDFFRNFPGAPTPNTWYPVALANSLAKTDLSAGPDIDAEFASTNIPWYLGTDGNTPPGQLDLTSVVLHELGHGLGFTDSTDYSGGIGSYGYGTGTPFTYDRFIMNTGGTMLLDYPNDSSALGQQLRSNALVWGGAGGVNANGGVKPKLYAPTTWEPGSSIAHLDEDTYGVGDPDSLMTPYLDDGESVYDPGDVMLGMMRDTGWTTAAAKGIAAAPSLRTAAAGNQHVDLTWGAPIDTGRQRITGYRIYRYTNGASTSDAFVDVTTTYATFSGLTNGTSYRFGIAALNASGTGIRSTLTEGIKPANTAPFGNIDGLVKRQYLDFHGREASASELAVWRATMHSGSKSPGGIVDAIASLPTSADAVGRMVRLYSAYFGRLPDASGMNYWVAKLRAGYPLGKVSDTFATSSEFKTKYGTLSNGAFVDLVYENVLHRAPDANGRAHWKSVLDTKQKNRGAVMTSFSESSENTRKMASEVTSVLLRRGMLRHLPTAGEYTDDQAYLDGGGTRTGLAAQFLASAEYLARF